MIRKYIAYPLLRLARRALYQLGFRATDSYDDRTLARAIVRGDVTALSERASSDCLLTHDFLQKAGATKVLDFGGGGGRHGFQYLDGALATWAVVETPSMVRVCSEQLAHPALSFHESVAEAVRAHGQFEVVHVSSSLQYTPDPEEFLRQLVGLHTKRLIIEKFVVTESDSAVALTQYSFLSDNLPVREEFGNPLSITKYGLIAIPEWELLRQVGEHYKIVDSWEDPPQSHLPLRRGLKQVGLILEAKND
jgi:putative methyltransferase (TIGR04325 family)